MKGIKMKKLFRAYMINCNSLCSYHSYVTGKTQEEATSMALRIALKQGRKNVEVIGCNVEFN
jgi:hypothetical protein